MHKVTKIFILAALSFISTHSSYANYANSNYGSNPNYRQTQVNYGQNAPDMNEEDGFMMQSRNRFNQMNQTNRNMVQQDQRMMREGFDPNENYYNNSSNRSYVQYDRNNPYRNQEQMMRGNVRYSTQPRTDDQAIDPSNSNNRRSFTNKPDTQR